MFCTRAHVRALMTQTSCAVGMRNAKPGNHLNLNNSFLKLQSATTVPFSSPEAALLFVSTKNRDLWPSPTPEVRNSRTSRHSAHVQSQV